MAVKRDIKYLNRDFTSLRSSLIDFAKTYFPTTYNDFTPASPGMMFMEMAAYVGDVMSFYLDNQLQENFITYARETSNVYELAYLLGYTPKVTAAANVTLDFYQTLPVVSTGSNFNPDWNYALYVAENATVKGTDVGVTSFITTNPVDFTVSGSSNPTEVSVYQINSSNQPVSYLVKKSVNAISATINSTNFTFGVPTEFPTVTITDNNIIGILDVVDSDGNVWYEVSHLAQDSVFDSITNTNQNDPNRSADMVDVPFLLQTKQVQRRFATRFLNETTFQLQFGSGNVYDTDEDLVPNPDNVGLGLPYTQNKLTTAYSPTNFIFTNTYGIAPSNTTLTVRYLTGGGVSSNVSQGSINQIVTSNTTFKSLVNPNSTTANTTFNSLAVTNPAAASGGQDGDTIEEIKQNALANFQNQLRTVTADDYLLRVLSMPGEYGSIAKAYAQAEKLSDLMPGQLPGAVSIYVLAYNGASQLVNASEALKQNIRTYLSQYRIINDTVKIKDAYVINIGVDFEIVTYPGYNGNQVLASCLTSLKDYFNIANWQINEPILLKNLYVALDQIDGVQTVKSIDVYNKAGALLGYSDYSYDTVGATLNNVVYPSLDPMIFEVKYPDTDITGKVVPF